MSAPSEIQALANERPWLFELLYAFNYCPADYVHPTRRPATASPGSEVLWSQLRARPALSELLLRELALHDRPCVDVRCVQLPLALFDSARLAGLAMALGAVVLAPRIRASIARDAVLAWKQRLTPRAYDFAMQAAPLLPLAGLLPQDPNDACAIEIGYDWIAASLDDAPHELRQRALLKLPADARRGVADANAARQVVPRIHATLEPRWCSSFAPIRH